MNRYVEYRQTCSKCGRAFITTTSLQDSDRLCLDCFMDAKRSGVPQGCPPSATGSADARASDEAGADSSGRSAEAERSVRELAHEFRLREDMALRQMTAQAAKEDKTSWAYWCASRDAYKICAEKTEALAPTLAVQRERVLQPNGELNDRRKQSEL